MSIWCGGGPEIGRGFEQYDGEFDDPNCDRVGLVLSYAHGWSNHYPDPVNGPEQHAAIGLATLPGFCVPGHNQNGENYRCTGCGAHHPDGSDDHGPWLRMEVASWAHDWAKGGAPTGEQEGVTVELDVDAARALGERLLAWANEQHVLPLTDDGDSR